MVDNRGISPAGLNAITNAISNTSANKMSDEKMGQGGEYFAQEMQEEETQEQPRYFQDRSAQLRASLDSLAMANSMMVMKKLKEKDKKEKLEEKEKQETGEK